MLTLWSNLITVRLTSTVVVYLVNNLAFRCETNAGADWCTEESQNRKKKLPQNREQRYNKYMANRHYRRKKVTKPRLSFRHSGHLAKHLTSAHRENAFFWAAAVYFSSDCQERVAACRQCTHRLCLVNSTSDIHETAEGCRSTEIDFCFCFFLFFSVFFSPLRFLTTKHLCIKNRNGCTLKSEPYIENLVNQAWINTRVAVDLERFKHLKKNDDVADDSKGIYCEGVKQVKNALCVKGAQEHCGGTLMEIDAFFIMSGAINVPVSLILLLSWKWLPFKLNLYVFWCENEKFFKINT